MRSVKLFLGTALLAVSCYMMVASAQAAAGAQVGPLVFSCDHTKNCYTLQNDCSQGGKFMQCQCNTKKDACYINNSGGN
ncbi:MAG: hypothetical protein ABSC08_05520 [Bryobacteraceae bacterium]|jgi:hypothetical protein